MTRQLTHFSFALCLIFLVVLVYFPGLHGPYVLDDEENITLNDTVALKEITRDSIYNALLSNQSGPFKRPLASLSFALNHYFAGGFNNTLPFKLTNVVIHIINALLIYYLSLLFLRRPVFAHALTNQQQMHVAGFAASLWALHPIQLTSVLYVVQRMNSLSALFVILGLIVFMHGRQSLEKSNKRGFLVMLAGIGGGTLLGAGAKENAVLLPIFALVIELTLYRRDHLSHSAKTWLRAFYVLTIVVPTVIFISYVAMHPGFFLDSYKMRVFSPHERLLTEMRVLWFYLSLLLLPSIRRLGLFHDDIPISTGLLHPITTLPAVIGIFVILAFALIKFRRYPIASFAILWFLAGHSLESSIFGLEIAYEHRNYLPSFGVIFAVAYFIINMISAIRTQTNKKIMTILPYAIILIFGLSTWTWASTWKDAYILAEYHARNHPESPRSNNFAANASIREKNDFVGAITYTVNGMRAAPDEVGSYLDMQVYLAYIASEINTSFTNAHVNMSGKEFHIAALPDYIQTKNINGKLILVYGPSEPDAINELLRNKPISVYGIVALDRLTTCIVNKVPHCQLLHHDAIKWLTSAVTNTQTTSEYRALIAADTAKLYANIGDFRRALTYITSANQMFPETLYYEIGKAEYLIRLGQTAEAGALLSAIEESGIPSEKDRETVKMLREMQKDAAGHRH